MSAYSSLEALLHDAFWAADGDPVELDLLDGVLREYRGRSIEIGCGSGRLLLPLLQRGHEVEGLDLSSDMISLCGDSARSLGLQAVLHQGDMATFEPSGKFSTVLLPAFTLQLAEDPSVVLKHWHAKLEKDGAIYLSVFVPLAEIHGELPEGEWYPDHETRLPDGRKASVQTRHRLDRKERILSREHLYRLGEGDGALEHRSRQTLRWFTPRQLRRLLEETGFTPVHAVADFDPEFPVDDDAQIVTVVARKKAGHQE